MVGSATHPQGQALEEVAQQLVATGTEVLVIGLAEQGAQFGLGDREVHRLEEGVDIVVLELKGYPQLLQDLVVAHRQLDGRQWAALVAAALEDHQAIEEVRHGLVRAMHDP